MERDLDFTTWHRGKRAKGAALQDNRRVGGAPETEHRCVVTPHP
jgi:hypothetical protein